MNQNLFFLLMLQIQLLINHGVIQIKYVYDYAAFERWLSIRIQEDKNTNSYNQIELPWT